jgi:hypothetical protein
MQGKVKNDDERKNNENKQTHAQRWKLPHIISAQSSITVGSVLLVSCAEGGPLAEHPNYLAGGKACHATTREQVSDAKQKRNDSR